MFEHPQIGLDTQCFSYLIDAMMGVDRPVDTLSSQRIALLRIYLYLPGTFWITETVQKECSAIRNPLRVDLHHSFTQSLFGVLSSTNQSAVLTRAAILSSVHTGKNDCQILSEAEDVGHIVLLTFDKKFVKRLSFETGIKIVEPLQYWTELGIPQGIEPNKVPSFDNPLSKQSWWRW